MRRSLKTLLAVASLSALAACSDGTFAGMNFIAGSQVNTGDFGVSTANNTAVMSGRKSAMIGLSRRFADEVPTTVNFAFNSAVLDAQARATLRRQADWILQFPEVRFRVYGHTDLVGTNAYNKRLGMRRALAVVRYLTSRGISRRRLEAVVSYGETQPLIVTEGRERRNRRTVTDVSGFVASNRLILDGKYAELVYRKYVASANTSANAGAGSQSSTKTK